MISYDNGWFVIIFVKLWHILKIFVPLLDLVIQTLEIIELQSDEIYTNDFTGDRPGYVSE